MQEVDLLLDVCRSNSWLTCYILMPSHPQGGVQRNIVDEGNKVEKNGKEKKKDKRLIKKITLVMGPLVFSQRIIKG